MLATILTVGCRVGCLKILQMRFGPHAGVQVCLALRLGCADAEEDLRSKQRRNLNLDYANEIHSIFPNMLGVKTYSTARADRKVYRPQRALRVVVRARLLLVDKKLHGGRGASG